MFSFEQSHSGLGDRQQRFCATDMLDGIFEIFPLSASEPGIKSEGRTNRHMDRQQGNLITRHQSVWQDMKNSKSETHSVVGLQRLVYYLLNALY